MKNPRIAEQEIESNWSEITAILRDSHSNLHHRIENCNSSTISRKLYDHSSKKREERGNWSKITVRRRERSKHRFIFGLEACSRIFRSNLQTISGIFKKNLLVFARIHHRRFEIKNKRWIEGKFWKRFEEVQDETLKTQNRSKFTVYFINWCLNPWLMKKVVRIRVLIQKNLKRKLKP